MGRNGKKAANNRNTQHENGVVAPGKRVNRQKSTGHLNGSAEKPKEKEKDNALLEPTQPQTLSNVLAANGGSRHPLSKSPEPASDDAGGAETANSTQTKMAEQQHHRIDVASAKQAVVQESGPFHLTMTVLRSSPIGDTLAILIVLLSLPPTILHLLNVIFAMLTFVPPSGSFSSFSLGDLFASFSPATPSFVVIMLIDFTAIGIWTVMPWPRLQGIALDCAQATVATTLGGGYNFRSATSDNVGLMLGIVLVTHLGRYRKTTLRWLHKTLLSQWLPGIEDFDDLPPRPSYVLSGERTWLDTIQVYVAIHILCQGVVRTLRRSLNTRPSTYSKSIDPEANAHAQISEHADSHNPPSSPSILKSKSSLQNLRDVKDKISSGKRRRKQANYVRSQQPLWAAIAATKAKIMREYQQSQATKDAMAPDSDTVENVGSAAFVSEENRIWITMICQDKFYFETGPIPQCPELTSTDNLEDEAGIDKSKSFYVRINGANWASVKILETPSGRDVHGRTRWVGEVYGLLPANSYRVSFARCEDGVELHSEVVVTPSSPSDDPGTQSNPAPLQPIRPSSPASPAATLKTSIAAFESSNSEINAAIKRIRKEHKGNSTRLSKELEVLGEKLARNLNATKGLSSRQLQQSQSIRQSEETISSISTAIESFAEVPEDALEDWQEHRASWERIRNEFSRVTEDLQRTKEGNAENLTAVQGEHLSITQKRERLQARAKKLSDQYERLTSPTANPENSENPRLYSEQATRELYWAHVEAKHQNAIAVQQRQYEDITSSLNALKAEIDTLEYIGKQNEAAHYRSQARLQQDSRPITPEGDLPGTNPNPPGSSQSISRFGPFSTPESQYAVPVGSVGSTGQMNSASWDRSSRMRSHSALAGNSGYHGGYEEDDEDPIPPSVHKRSNGFNVVREGSDSRSSGSGSPHIAQVPPIRHRGKISPAGP